MADNNSLGLIRDGFSKLIAAARDTSTRSWELLKSYPLHFAVVIMAAYAFWDARIPVTMIAPFQVSKNDFPFSGEIVADAVQDGLKSIRNEIENEKQDTGLRSSDTGLPDLRNILVPDFSRVQEPPRISVEIKGVSYERVLTVLRALLHTETLVSGDVIVSSDKTFTLVARASNGGPWESSSRPISVEGLKQASKELAQKIVAAEDPTLAGVALLKDGQIDEGLAQLSRAYSLKPADTRLKLNLCMGFAANRRYQEAIECYSEASKADPNAQQISFHLAQAYYLNGDRVTAKDQYKKLHDAGYRPATLAYGEALDDMGDPGAAIAVYDQFLAAVTQDRYQAIAHVKKSLALAHQKSLKTDKNSDGDPMAEYAKALKYAPRDVLILVNQGLELAQSKDLDAGIAQIQSVVDGNQSSDSLPFALVQLGVLLEKKDDWAGAINRYKQAAELRPTYVEAHLKLGHAFVHEHKNHDALNEYDKVARLSGSDLERGYSQLFANQWLANDLRNVGDYDGAAKAYEAAIHIKSDDSAAHCQLALIRVRQKRLSLAVQEYDAALNPAKLEKLNDKECLAMADQLLDVTLDGGKSAREKQTVAGINRASEWMKLASQSLPPRTALPVIQASLQTQPN